jgi:hypothetical protein
VQLAAADLLIRMDADDICRPGRFAKQIAHMRAHPECVALGSRVMLIDAEGWPIAEFPPEQLDHCKIDAAHLAGTGGVIPHPSAVIRKAAILQVGGYRADYAHAEDIDLFLRLAEVGQLANLSDVLLDYRQHADSIGYRYSAIQQTSARRAVSAACNRRDLGQPDWLVRKVRKENTPSISAVHRKWGWWALRAGNRRTAGKHALKALSFAPIDGENIRLCACVLRGH